MTRAQRTGELSKDIRALQENPDCTKEPLCKYIFSVDVYEDLIGIRSTADWAKGNSDVTFMKEVKTNYAASNEADGVIIDGMAFPKRYFEKIRWFQRQRSGAAVPAAAAKGSRVPVLRPRG